MWRLTPGTSKVTSAGGGIGAVGHVVVALLLTTACGPSPSPTSAQKATGSSAAVAPPVDEKRCLASFARNRPAGWTDAGRLVVTLDEGRPTAMTAEDARGNVVETAPAPKSKEAARETMRSLTCRLGGLVLVVGGSELASKLDAGRATFAVLAPARPDEKTDLTALCREPADIPADADERQRYRIAFDTLDERLTTRRWRAWLWDLLDESDKVEGAARESLRSAKADELRAEATAAGIAGPCWYETSLRKRPHR